MSDNIGNPFDNGDAPTSGKTKKPAPFRARDAAFAFWPLLKSNPKLFAQFALAIGVYTVAFMAIFLGLGLLVAHFNNVILSGVVGVAYLAAGIFFYGILIPSMIQYSMDGSLRFGSPWVFKWDDCSKMVAIKWAQIILIAYAVAGVLVGGMFWAQSSNNLGLTFVCMISLLVAEVLGIIAFLRISVWPQLVIDGSTTPLKQSWAMTKGQGWRHFRAFFILLLAIYVIEVPLAALAMTVIGHAPLISNADSFEALITWEMKLMAMLSPLFLILAGPIWIAFSALGSHAYKALKAVATPSDG